MNKKLFEIEIECRCYVLADDEDQARDIACQEERDWLRSRQDEYEVFAFTAQNSIWHDWHDSLPFSADNEQETCGQIMERLREEAKQEAYRREIEAKVPQQSLIANP